MASPLKINSLTIKYQSLRFATATPNNLLGEAGIHYAVSA